MGVGVSESEDMTSADRQGDVSREKFSEGGRGVGSVEGKEAGGRKALYTASSRKAGQAVGYLSVENC